MGCGVSTEKLLPTQPRELRFLLPMNVLNTITSRLFKPKQAEPVREYHLALELTPTVVKASLWDLWNDEVEVRGTGRSVYGQGDWEGALESTDAAIAQAAESAHVAITEVSKVMFGLPDSWIVSDKIQEPYFAHLKRIAKELDLTPLAFVSLSESLSYYYKQREGSPLSGVLIGVFGQTAAVTVIRAGVASASKIFTRGNDSIAVDLEQVLSHFGNVDVFPPRMVLYGDSDIHSLTQELLAHSWVNNGLFVHFPKVEEIPSDADVLSVSLAGGLDLARRTGVDTGSVTVREITSASEPVIAASVSSNPVESAPVQRDPAQSLGFIKGRDYAKETGSYVPVSHSPVSHGKPVTASPQTPSIQDPVVARVIPRREIPSENLPLSHNELKPRSPFRLPALPRIPFPFHFGRGALPIIGALVVTFFVLGIGGVWAYWTLPKARVRLMVEPRVLEKEIAVVVNPSLGANSNGSLEIPGKEATVTVKEAMRTVAQGTKTVGDKAKGEVTLYNKTQSVKTFPSGSVLILGGSSLKFVLDSEVKVASASESVGKLEYGSSNATVTAMDIGTDSNISAGNTFSFKDFGMISYSAHNDSAFSGGSSRKVTVVTKNDQDRLEATLAAELKEKAKQDIQTQIGSGERLLDGSITTTVSSRKFDKTIDEEAKEVGLTMEVVAKGITFTEENLKKMVVFSSRDSVPSEFLLREEDITYATEFGKVLEDGKTSMNVRYKVNLVPDLKTDQIARDLAGKQHAVADRYLTQKNLLADFSIEYDPPLPGFLKALPRNPKNIKVEVIPR